jgi:hypothetical protein
MAAAKLDVFAPHLYYREWRDRLLLIKNLNDGYNYSLSFPEQVRCLQPGAGFRQGPVLVDSNIPLDLFAKRGRQGLDRDDRVYSSEPPVGHQGKSDRGVHF